MAEEEIGTVELRDGFYRDIFGKVLFIIISFCVAIILLIALILYLYLDKPPPITFHVGNEMRVLSPVPLNQPYLSEPDVLQWVTNVIPRSLSFDFNHYNNQLKAAQQYFTATGWRTFVNQLNIYANYNNVQTYKLFVTASPTAAPIIKNQGVIPETGIYGWWVEMPIMINYAGYQPPAAKTVTLQVLVVRVSTLNNLTGVGIDNVLQAPGTLAPGAVAPGAVALAGR